MDSDRLNRWLTLGANIGVLIGLALLIFEIRQNHDLMQAQVRNDMSQNLNNLQSLIAANPGLANLVRRSMEDDDFSPDETIQLRRLQHMQFRIWENQSYQYRMGLFEADEYIPLQGAQERILGRNPGLVRAWCEYRRAVSEVFRTEIDGHLPDGACERG